LTNLGYVYTNGAGKHELSLTVFWAVCLWASFGLEAMEQH